MNEYLMASLGGLVRTALAAAGGWFVVRGFVTPDQSATFQTDATTRILQYVTLMAPAVWSLVAKYRAAKLAEAKRQLPADASDAEVRAKAWALGLSDLFGHGQRADMEQRLAKLEAWSAAIQDEKQARSQGAAA